MASRPSSTSASPPGSPLPWRRTLRPRRPLQPRKHLSPRQPPTPPRLLRHPLTTRPRPPRPPRPPTEHPPRTHPRPTSPSNPESQRQEGTDIMANSTEELLEKFKSMTVLELNDFLKAFE